MRPIIGEESGKKVTMNSDEKRDGPVIPSDPLQEIWRYFSSHDYYEQF
jgi:hypothetical protein